MLIRTQRALEGMVKLVEIDRLRLAFEQSQGVFGIGGGLAVEIPGARRLDKHVQGAWLVIYQGYPSPVRRMQRMHGQSLPHTGLMTQRRKKVGRVYRVTPCKC